MKRRGLAWTPAVVFNAIAVFVLLIVLLDDPPWERFGLDGKELALFYLASVYFAFRARNTDEWFEETLMGLWIRARKVRPRREIGQRRDTDS